jgi:hypothetical protein
MRQFLDLLNDEWQYLAHSPEAARALARWSQGKELGAFVDLHQLVAEIQRRGHPEESDRLLLALLRRAPSDDLAARTVLHAMMPGLKSLMSAYQLTAVPEEVSTAVVEAAFERIRRYPCDRRPARVAANLLNDTRQVLWRASVRERRLRLATEPITEPITGATMDRRLADLRTRPSATDELVDLVVEAVRLGHVERSGARLILLTRVLDASVEELAHEMDVKAPTLRKRRIRAEAALASTRECRRAS